MHTCRAGASRRHLALPVVLAAAAALSACSGDASPIAAPPSIDDPSVRRAPETPAPAIANPLSGALLYVDPLSNARRSADAWRATRPTDAALLDKIAGQPQVRWFGNWNTAVRADVDASVSAQARAGALPVIVAYNIPQRDCGGLSGNNTTSVAGYRNWISAFAEGIGARRAVVILEPDALAGMGCLSPADQQVRLDLFHYAIQALSASGTVSVYLDAGNPRWQPAATMAERLVAAGVASTNGFTLNLSNFLTTEENVAYGGALSALVGGKHFLVDTGRNGAGGNGTWCNPTGQALGSRPSTSPGIPLVDAFLWVKAPGESDGACNGAAASGEWMPDYALGLAKRASW
jgi:endoglucanase